MTSYREIGTHQLPPGRGTRKEGGRGTGEKGPACRQGDMSDAQNSISWGSCIKLRLFSEVGTRQTDVQKVPGGGPGMGGQSGQRGSFWPAAAPSAGSP